MELKTSQNQLKLTLQLTKVLVLVNFSEQLQVLINNMINTQSHSSKNDTYKWQNQEETSEVSLKDFNRMDLYT